MKYFKTTLPYNELPLKGVDVRVSIGACLHAEGKRGYMCVSTGVGGGWKEVKQLVIEKKLNIWNELVEKVNTDFD